MKSFFEGLLEWKTMAALMFSASTIACMAVLLYLGEIFIPIYMLIALLALTVIGTFLHFLAFTDHIIKKVHFMVRIIVLAIPFTILVIASSWLLQMVVFGDMMHWAMFAGIIMIIFVGGTVSFEIYYHMMGKKYDGLLGLYRKEKSNMFEELKKELVKENELRYGAEIREKYGEQVIDESNKNLMGLSEDKYDESEKLRLELEKALLAAFSTGDPASTPAQEACDLHRKWLSIFYPDYDKEYHRSMGELYVSDERFRANYDKLAPGCTDFFRDAIDIYCAN